MYPLGQKVAKSSKSYNCIYCDYITSRKTNWLKHLKTNKHFKNCNQNVTSQEKMDKKPIIQLVYTCKKCDYKTSRLNDYEKHLSTLKCSLKTRTKLAETRTKLAEKVAKKFKCKNCDKIYKSRMGLWRHNKKCKKIEITKLVPKQTIVQNITNNYNCFNVFLDEYCKNAQTLKDFVNSLNVSLQDLDYTTQNGYVKGISNILNKQLEDLSPIDRPIHSTDQKRLQFMVKNKDGWVKDDGSKLNDCVIRETKFKLVNSLSDWEKKNPGYNNNPDKLNIWQKSLSQIQPPIEMNEKYNKAINKNIAKFTIKDAINSTN
jgi:hypothetical protein